MKRSHRAGALGIAVLLACTTLGGRMSPAAAAPPPPIKHVFVIVLENKDFDETFGASSLAPYLSKTLTSQGQLLTQYFGIGHNSLDNYIAMISGQAPNPVTQADCQVFQDFAPPTGVLDADGQAVGQGCVYPANVPTLAGQLDTAGLSWRGYMQDMKPPCRHPALNAQDTTQQAKVGDQYAARHNPFVYFHSIIDDDAACQAQVVDLAQLDTDLQSESTTPNLAFITPDLCHDGHDTPCVDQQPGGLTSSDAFLQEWVPKILASAAYERNGMLLITFDEAEGSDAASSTACCGEVPGPNSPQPGIGGPGGGRVGGVLLSPFTAAGSTNDTPYSHYALLRSLEDIFGLPHLGFAAADGLQAFGDDVFNAAPSAPSTTATTAAPAAGAVHAETGPLASLPRTGRSSPTPWIAGAVILSLALVMLRRRVRNA